MVVRTLVVWFPGWPVGADFSAVVSALERMCPLVEVVQPGECALASHGPSRYFGGDSSLCAAVADELRLVTDRSFNLGVADGPFAARIAARRGRVVAPGSSASFLAALPVEVLGRPDLADLLVRLGLYTLGDFAALPAQAVRDRLGPDGALAHRLAKGDDERPLSPRPAPADLAVWSELDPPATRVDTVAFVARGLANRLGERLGSLGVSCTRVRVEAETEDGERLSRVWSRADAFAPATLAERVRWQLEWWLSGRAGPTPAPTSALSLLRLEAEEVVPDGRLQGGFWGQSGETDDEASRALTRVQGLLGPSSVMRASLQGGRGPAERVRLYSWGSLDRPDASARAGERPVWPGRLPEPSPAVVYQVPLAAHLLDGDGDEVTVDARGVISSRPATLCTHRSSPVAVEQWAGPWPADERWWDPSSRRRRARLQLVLESGDAYLLCLESGSWSVEAAYD